MIGRSSDVYTPALLEFLYLRLLGLRSATRGGFFISASAGLRERGFVVFLVWSASCLSFVSCLKSVCIYPLSIYSSIYLALPVCLCVERVLLDTLPRPPAEENPREWSGICLEFRVHAFHTRGTSVLVQAVPGIWALSRRLSEETFPLSLLRVSAVHVPLSISICCVPTSWSFFSSCPFFFLFSSSLGPTNC